MSKTRSRSESVRMDEELRLPRSPGVFRRFWARHPVTADIIIAVLCLIVTLTSSVGVTNLDGPFSAATHPLMLAAVVVACASLLWRRQAPLIPFIASFVIEAILLFSDLPNGTPFLAVACYSIAVYRTSRMAWTCLAIAVVALFAFAATFSLLGVIDVNAMTIVVVSAVMLGLIGTLIGVNVGERKRYIAAVIDRSRQLLVERDQQAKLAAAGERARIAREMHDIVSHSLTVIVALSEGAAATADPTKARAASTATASTARAALTEMRAMLGVLRGGDESAPLTPLEGPTPHETVTTAQRAGFPVSLSVTGSDDVPTAVAHAMSRLVQEGVTNAMRHAPAATSIAVRIARESETVTVEIVNDGIVEATDDPGFGLRGLSERVAHVHGRIEYGPNDQGRWVLRAVLPTVDQATEG